MLQRDILTGSQKEAGLSVEDDEDLVFLTFEKKVVAVWSTAGATANAIRDEAECYLSKIYI